MNLNLVFTIGDWIRIIRNAGMERDSGRSELQKRRLQVKTVRRRGELQIQIVRERRVLRVFHMPIVVGNNALVRFGKRREANVCPQIIKIGVQWSLAVVVVDLAVCQLDVFDREIEDAGVTAALARGSRGKIVLAFTTDLEMNHRMSDEKFPQRNLVMHCR